MAPAGMFVVYGGNFREIGCIYSTTLSNNGEPYIFSL